MKNRITAAIAAAAIALTAAAPVRAEQSDFLRLAIGAVGVGLLIHQLDKKNKQEIANAASEAEEWPQGDRWAHDDTRRRGGDFYGHKPRGRIVPAQCIFDGKSRGRWYEVVSQRCMERFGADRRLPRECRIEVKSRGDRRQAYELSCLEYNGYRVVHARR